MTDLYEYARLDAVALRTLISRGEVSKQEVAETARAAIASVDDDLGALAAPLFDEALDHSVDGRFAGVPFLIKDSAPFARGVAFRLGSRAVRGIAVEDHPMMARFRELGFATLGISTAPEFSLSFATESRLTGVTRNPWALDRGVGGSSGGAAALVAAGAVPIAHATDGAGSIRVPASVCGLVGLKPTRGRTPGAESTAEFVLTRSVRDAAAVLAYFGVEPSVAPSLRVGIATASWSHGTVDGQVVAATEAVGRMLEWAGHAVSVASPRVDHPTVVEAAMRSVYAAGDAVLAAPRRPDPALLEAVSRRVLDETASATPDDRAAADAAAHALTREIDDYFERFDLLVTPTIAEVPARHGRLDYDDARHTVRSWFDAMFEFGPFTAPFNVSGHPAISLPLGESREGLPIGVQLVAARGRDDLLLGLAAELEIALPWRDREPSIFVG